jgi:hypothetical protein
MPKKVFSPLCFYVANIAAAATFSALTNYRTAAKQTPLLPHQQGKKKVLASLTSNQNRKI